MTCGEAAGCEATGILIGSIEQVDHDVVEHIVHPTMSPNGSKGEVTMRNQRNLALRGLVMILLALAATGLGTAPVSAQGPACVNEPSLEFFDSNGDGVISIGELQAVASQFPDPELQALVAEAAASPSFGGIQYRGCSPGAGTGGGSGNGTGSSGGSGTTIIDNPPADGGPPAEADQSTDTSIDSTTEPSDADCTAVELYPGYPGYRGNITGVMPHWNGQGDYECLETLQQNDPEFDRAQEDLANQEAADALGIEGPMSLWTWENWMQIEAERGMLPSCYTCLMIDTTTEPIRTDIQADPGDFRIRTGLMGQTTAIDSILESLEVTDPETADLVAEAFTEDDYVLRAHAYATGEPGQNAEQLYEEMQGLVETLADPEVESATVDPIDVLRIAIWERGGYTSTPDTAAPDDQFALMSYAFHVAEIYSATDAWEPISTEFEDSITAWVETGPNVPLDAFMQERPEWLEFSS